MDTVTVSAGRTPFLIESTTAESGPVVVTTDDYGTITTGISTEAVKDAYSQLKDLLSEIASDIGATFDRDGTAAPTSVEVSFGLTFSAGANVWVMRTGAEVALTVTLGWTKP